MTRLPLLVAAAALTLTASAEARPVPPGAVAATYNTQTKRFCVMPEALQAAGVVATSRSRECLTQGSWRTRGVRFARPLASGRQAGL